MMLSLALRKRTQEELDLEELNGRLRQLEERSLLYLDTIRTFIYLVKEFSIDLSEIGSQEFKNQMDRFGEQFVAENKIRRAESHFEKIKPVVLSFIQRQKHYLKEREDELREIIDLLSKAMVSMNSDNEAYHQKIYAQSEQLEKITLLDDIKKIKSTLAAEVETIKDTVRQKQARDQRQVIVLSEKVEALHVELEQAKEASLTDALTEIANRRAFDQKLLRCVEQNLIGKLPFSLILIDIDDFKRVNDRYGHLIGDRVLMAMADSCKQSIRADDFIARFGGEEFAILLPGASRKNAVKKAQHLCRQIANTRYALSDGEDSDQLSITVSMGVAAFERGDTCQTLIDRADKALYQAKTIGKNRVEGA